MAETHRSRFSVSSEKEAALDRRLQRLGIVEADLAEKFIRASGPGGQKVNKTSTAVHLKHLPTGVEVKAQSGRTQAINRFIARRRLADKIEARIEGRRTAEQQRVAKIKRQKRRRSRRAKAKMLEQKRQQSEKKRARAKPRRDGD